MVKPNDDAGAAYPGLQVDLNGIDDFVAALRKEVEENLSPSIDRLQKTYEMGVCFGPASGTPNMNAAKKVYDECLTRIRALLNGYVTAGQVLAAAAEQVAKQYRDTDAMAAASTHVVSNALSMQIQMAQQGASAESALASGVDQGYGEW